MILTIFTPTFNRAYILGRLYDSIRKQSSRDFEWIIVDDGSTDNTEDLVKGWISCTDIKIVYRKQKNQGKHIAINEGVKLATGELFFVVDSDDFISPDAVKKILDHWVKFGAGRINVSGIVAYKCFLDGRISGTLVPSNVQYCTFREVLNRYHSHGEKAVIHRVDILKQYPYPRFEGETFFGESYVFDQIDDHYTMSIMHEAVYWFEYQSDGLSRDFRTLYRNNPQGFYMIFRHQSRYLSNIKGKIKNAAHLDALALHLHRSIFEAPNRCWRIIALPLGLWNYFRIFILKRSDVKWYLKGTKK